MKLRHIRPLSVLITALAIASSAFADCGALLSGITGKSTPIELGARVEKVWKFGRLDVPYTALGVRANRRGYFDVQDVLTPLQQEEALVFGVHKEHPYIWYRGYRFDTSGEAGLKVVTKMTKSKYLYGDMAFVLTDLPTGARHNLDALIDQHEQKSYISCARAACSYINIADGNILQNKNYRTTSRIMRALITEKLRGRSIEILVFGGADPRDIYKQITDIEFSVQTNLFVGASVASIIPLSLVGALIQFLPL